MITYHLYALEQVNVHPQIYVADRRGATHEFNWEKIIKFCYDFS